MTEIDILNVIQTWRNPVLDQIMIGITQAGNGILWGILIVLAIAYKKTRKQGYLMCTALLLEFLISYCILKPSFSRIRPCDVNTAIQLLIRHPSDYSFPSGHTGAAFAVAGGWFFSEGRYRKVLYILPVLIGFSRMYLYVHYPTDVLAGAILGTACAYIAYRFLKNREELKRTEEKEQSV